MHRTLVREDPVSDSDSDTDWVGWVDHHPKDHPPGVRIIAAVVPSHARSSVMHPRYGTECVVGLRSAPDSVASVAACWGGDVLCSW